MSDIVMATDLSSRADRAFGRALQLAKQQRLRIRILFVIDDALPAAVADRLEREAEGLIARSLLPFAAAADVETALAIRRGRAYEAILAEAEAADAGLVVLGTHRADDARDLFIGSTAWRILREARRPVLQVRDAVSAPYRRVMAAVDNTPSAYEVLRLACRFSAGAELSAVHAFRVPFIDTLPGYEARQAAAQQHRAEFEAALDAALRSLLADGAARPVIVHAEAHAGEVIEVVRRECDRTKPDLLVIGTRGAAGAEAAFHKSIAEALLRRPPCDIAAIGAPATTAKD
jgi:nucleotide-binding universal stress UspA family protein